MISFTKPVTELVTMRVSRRNYNSSKLPVELRKALQESISLLPPSPFGSRVRFALQDADDGFAGRSQGTYGMIRGAETFLIGVVREDVADMEDFGYLFEIMILRATDLGLSTCWIGGTLDRTRFGELAELNQGEIVPAVSPLGYAETKKTLVESVVRFGAGSKNRKPWSDLFFADNFETPLTEEQAGEYATCLEMVRRGPSSSNRQPWRIIKEKNRFHFFLLRSASYQKLFRMDLQRIDMGIAMCHFELTAKEAGLSGKWEPAGPFSFPVPKEMEYSVTWSSSKL